MAEDFGVNFINFLVIEEDTFPKKKKTKRVRSKDIFGGIVEENRADHRPTTRDHAPNAAASLPSLALSARSSFISRASPSFFTSSRASDLNSSACIGNNDNGSHSDDGRGGIERQNGGNT